MNDLERVIAKVLLLAALTMTMAGHTKTMCTSEDDNMYKTYRVQRVQEPIKIDSDWNKPAWRGIEALTLGLHMGEEPRHRPKTEAKLAWDDEHIYAIFRVQDRYVRALATEYFGNVWEDSCVEFFFTPKEDLSEGYFNLETNCIGAILMFHQKAIDRDRRYLCTDDLDTIRLATSLPKGKPIDPEIAEPNVWTVEYAFPWRMLRKYAGIVEPAPGERWRANFYKCGDKTSHPHWLTWSKIPLENPSFHQPDYFGYLEFVE